MIAPVAVCFRDFTGHLGSRAIRPLASWSLAHESADLKVNAASDRPAGYGCGPPRYCCLDTGFVLLLSAATGDAVDAFPGVRSPADRLASERPQPATETMMAKALAIKNDCLRKGKIVSHFSAVRHVGAREPG